MLKIPDTLAGQWGPVTLPVLGKEMEAGMVWDGSLRKALIWKILKSQFKKKKLIIRIKHLAFLSFYELHFRIMKYWMRGSFSL